MTARTGIRIRPREPVESPHALQWIGRIGKRAPVALRPRPPSAVFHGPVRLEQQFTDCATRSASGIRNSSSSARWCGDSLLLAELGASARRRSRRRRLPWRGGVFLPYRSNVEAADAGGEGDVCGGLQLSVQRYGDYLVYRRVRTFRGDAQRNCGVRRDIRALHGNRDRRRGVDRNIWRRVAR